MKTINFIKNLILIISLIITSNHLFTVESNEYNNYNFGFDNDNYNASSDNDSNKSNNDSEYTLENKDQDTIAIEEFLFSLKEIKQEMEGIINDSNYDKYIGAVRKTRALYKNLNVKNLEYLNNVSVIIGDISAHNIDFAGTLSENTLQYYQYKVNGFINNINELTSVININKNIINQQ